jgi:hypothetical protein
VLDVAQLLHDFIAPCLALLGVVHGARLRGIGGVLGSFADELPSVARRGAVGGLVDEDQARSGPGERGDQAPRDTVEDLGV